MLSEAEIETLTGVAGLMIPASEAYGVPGADDSAILPFSKATLVKLQFCKPSLLPAIIVTPVFWCRWDASLNHHSPRVMKWKKGTFPCSILSGRAGKSGARWTELSVLALLSLGHPTPDTFFGSAVCWRSRLNHPA